MTQRETRTTLLVDLGKDPIRIVNGIHQKKTKQRSRGTYSESRNKVYSSSLTLTGLPPYCTPSALLPQALRGRDPYPYLRNQDLVAGLHAHRNLVAILVQSAGSDSQNGTLVDVLDAALRQIDAASGLRLGLDLLDQHAVQEGNKLLDVSESLRVQWRILAVCFAGEPR